jgi:hypothetical protein
MEIDMNWIIARLSEPSTYAGIAGFVTSLNLLPASAAAAAPQIITSVGTLIASVLAIVIPEKKAS